MELQFHPKEVPLPYAAVAASLLAKTTPALSLKPVSSAEQPCWTLTQGAGVDGKPSTVTGHVPVLRFLARNGAPLASTVLYPEQKNASVASAVDGWFDYVRQPHAPMDMKLLISKINACPTTNGCVSVVPTSTAVTLADLALWGMLQSQLTLKKTKVPSIATSSSDFYQTWLKKMDALPECKKALELVNQHVPVAAANAQAAASNGITSSVSVQELLKKVQNGNVMELFRQEIAQQMSAVTGVDASVLAGSLDLPRGAVASVADLCFAVPRLRIKGNQAEVAADIASKLHPTPFVNGYTANGTFINISLNKTLLRDLLIPTVYNMNRAYGTNKSGSGKTVVVEFSSPNIAKPFHAGHLRSTIIGNFVRNVCDAQGMKTVAINYLGDWGKQYGLLAVGYEKFGSEEELKRDPIRHLFDVYVQINNLSKEDPAVDDQARAYFKKMEDGDPKALELWKRFRELSIVKYREIYARLNISFDIYSGESMYAEGMKRVMKLLQEKQLLTESDGALIVDLEPFRLTPPVVQKADGATLYITRDIAAAWERREEFKFDDMYYIVAGQQNLHFQQLFKILELAGFDWHKQCHHINFGMVKGMSTRKGTVVFLEDILSEAKSIMHAVMKKNPEHYNRIEDPETVADIIGVSAVIIQDMGARRIKDYDFNWDRMTSFEGDTGPYLQYSHARLASIERKYLESLGLPFDTSKIPNVPFDPATTLQALKEDKASDILLALANFPDLIAELPKKEFEPTHLVSYLMQLCHRVSSSYDELYVMGQPKEIAEARFWLYWSARVTVGNGMRMLGLRPLERM